MFVAAHETSLGWNVVTCATSGLRSALVVVVIVLRNYGIIIATRSLGFETETKKGRSNNRGETRDTARTPSRAARDH
jgi:hypothetical protein